MQNPDPDGFYAALKVSHDAEDDEIRLAYEMVKLARARQGRRVPKEIQAAFDVLGDKEKREAYGKKRARAERKRNVNVNLNSVPLLLSLLIIFVGIILFTMAPVIMAQFVSFEEGDSLYWKQTLKPLGVVRGYESEHLFDDGVRGPAYYIEHTAGSTAWYAAGDLRRHCGRR
jgi:curved DNA-binding protein CbpA